MAPDPPVSHDELRVAVTDAEVRGQELVRLTTEHFDQRLRDTERVLTWRMIATGGVVSVMSGLVGSLVSGQNPQEVAVGLLSLLS